jgi:hypothetical protein
MARKGQYKKTATKDSIRQRKYNSLEAQKKNRAARNKARRAGLRKGRVTKGDGKDIDHKTPLSSGGSKSLSNTRVVSRSKNRKSGGRIGGLH